MISSSFFNSGIFYTQPLILEKFYGVESSDMGYYIVHLTVATVIGSIILSPLFDMVGRRKMIFLVYLLSGLCIVVNGIVFVYTNLALEIQCILWFVTIMFSQLGASSINLTISEIYPTFIRSQAIALFFTLGMIFGGAIAPFFFGILVQYSDKQLIALGYYVAAVLMFASSIVAWNLGIDAENKPLEDV